MRRICMLALLLIAGSADALLINEIMANPAGSEYTDEFVELVQADSLGVDLAGWLLSDGSATDELVAWQGGPLWLGPGRLALLLDSGYEGAYDERVPAGVLRLTVADGALGSGGLSNSLAEPISLISPDGAVVDLVWTRPELAEGQSLERRHSTAHCDSCWAASLEQGGTPGAPNSVRVRVWDLSLLDVFPVCRVRASGSAGFRGSVQLHVGWPPCQVEDLQGPFELAAGQERLLPLPILPLAGQNPFKVMALPEAGEPRLLADTLVWRDLPPGALFVEAVQPAGEDWIQVAAGDPCPILLDGMVLESRSTARELAGWLPADGRLLAGGIAASCPVPLQDSRGLTLAQSGWARLSDVTGRMVDEAVWPEEAPPGSAPWRRLDPGQPGDRVANWVADPGLQPGCAPDQPDPGQPEPGHWWISSHCLDLDAPDPIRLTVAAPPGVSGWRLELWSLDGREVLHRPCTAQRMFWDGRLDDGHPCPEGLFILRLAGAGREEVRTLAVTGSCP